MPNNITVTISDEEEKALLTDMLTIQDWLDNAIHNKARQCIDNVCRQALEDETNTILTTSEKYDVVSTLATQGQIITTVKKLPEMVKHQIVTAAKIQSAAERDAEWERKWSLKTVKDNPLKTIPQKLFKR